MFKRGIKIWSNISSCHGHRGCACIQTYVKYTHIPGVHGHVTPHSNEQTKFAQFSFLRGKTKAEIYAKWPIFEPTFRLKWYFIQSILSKWVILEKFFVKIQSFWWFLLLATSAIFHSDWRFFWLFLDLAWLYFGKNNWQHCFRHFIINV